MADKKCKIILKVWNLNKQSSNQSLSFMKDVHFFELSKFKVRLSTLKKKLVLAALVEGL